MRTPGSHGATRVPLERSRRDGSRVAIISRRVANRKLWLPAPAGLSARRGVRTPSRVHRDEDEDAGEPVFLDCYICEGANNRPRRSSGSPVCKFTGCIKEHRRRRNERAPIEERTALAPPAKAARTACFEVREVVGIDLCVAASDRQKRAGRPLDDDNISYKVRGGFGEDEDDELIPDTRWVTLSELAANIPESGLKDLDKWASKLQTAVKAARKRLQERRRARE